MTPPPETNRPARRRLRSAVAVLGVLVVASVGAARFSPPGASADPAHRGGIEPTAAAAGGAGLTAAAVAGGLPSVSFVPAEHRMLSRHVVWRNDHPWLAWVNGESTKMRTGTQYYVSEVAVTGRDGDPDVVFAVEHAPSTPGNVLCYTPRLHPVSETTCYPTEIDVGPDFGELILKLDKPYERRNGTEDRRFWYNYHVSDLGPHRAEVSAAVESSALKIYDEIRVEPSAQAPACEDFPDLDPDRYTCKHLYEVTVDAPATTSAMREALPRLVQPSADYDLVYALEFNGEGPVQDGCANGMATLDYDIVSPSPVFDDNGCANLDRNGRSCTNVGGGVLTMGLRTGACERGITTAGKFSYKYGYLEVKYTWTLRRHGRVSNYQNYPFVVGDPRHALTGLLDRYGVGVHDYEDILKNVETELDVFEFLPRYNRETGHQYLHSKVLVHSADTPPMRTDRDIRFCGAPVGGGLRFNSTGCGRNNPITITKGYEWTPRGYQTYIKVDGVHDSLTRFPKNSTVVQRRSVSTASDGTVTYGSFATLTGSDFEALFEQLDPEDADFFLEQVGIAHLPMEIFTETWGSDPPGAINNTMDIDYIRVFQPRDKYADMEPLYQ